MTALEILSRLSWSFERFSTLNNFNKADFIL